MKKIGANERIRAVRTTTRNHFWADPVVELSSSNNNPATIAALTLTTTAVIQVSGAKSVVPGGQGISGVRSKSAPAR